MNPNPSHHYLKCIYARIPHLTPTHPILPHLQPLPLKLFGHICLWWRYMYVHTRSHSTWINCYLVNLHTQKATIELQHMNFLCFRPEYSIKIWKIFLIHFCFQSRKLALLLKCDMGSNENHLARVKCMFYCFIDPQVHHLWVCVCVYFMSDLRFECITKHIKKVSQNCSVGHGQGFGDTGFYVFWNWTKL